MDLTPILPISPDACADVLRQALAEGRTPAEALRRLGCASPYQPNRDHTRAVPILQALLRLHDEGAAPEALWALRDRLALLHGQPRPRWHWSFDHLPVRDDGWHADLTLWARCQPHVAAARAMDAAGHAIRSARFLRTVAQTRAALLQAGEAAQPLTDVLHAVFAWRPPSGRPVSANVWRPPRPPQPVPTRVRWMVGIPGAPTYSPPEPVKPTGAELGRTARAIATSLLAPPRTADSDALLTAFARWLAEVHGGDTRALETLTLLDQRGVAEARPQLATAAVASEGWTAAQRGQALHHLLAHPTAPTESA